jgi:hypothetical protein
VRAAWRAWERWAFAPVDCAPMAALRIAVGLLSLGWTLSLLPDVDAFLSSDGLQPELPTVTDGAWVVELGSPYAVLALLAVASVALALGWRTRVAAVVVAVLLLAVQRRDPYVLNSGDLLLRNLALLVALMPAGEVWSLDARRRGVSRHRAPWALRLLQLQVSAVYLFSVTAKLRGGSWGDGTAVGIALQLEDLQRLVVPDAISQSLAASAVLTYSTLVVEGALVVALWLPRTRYAAMAAGVAIHLGIEATLLIGWFSLAIIASYLAFVPAADLRAVVTRFRSGRSAGAQVGGEIADGPAGATPADGAALDHRRVAARLDGPGPAQEDATQQAEQGQHQQGSELDDEDQQRDDRDEGKHHHDREHDAGDDPDDAADRVIGTLRQRHGVDVRTPVAQPAPPREETPEPAPAHRPGAPVGPDDVHGD